MRLLKPLDSTVISIHAPTRGATSIIFNASFTQAFQSTLPQGERPPSAQSFTHLGVFQSTLPQGERLKIFTNDQRLSSFQSTLPQGERRHTYFTPPVHLDFNPRSHKGSDVR